MADSGASSKIREHLDEEMEGSSGDEDDGDVFEVEKIVGISKIDGQTMYKVRWVGYGPSNDTYEPYDNLLSCVDMIEDYVSQQKEQKKKREEEKKKKYDVIVQKNPEGPKLKDPFWDDLEKGKINILDGHDMYSKIKSGRAARPTTFKDSSERRRRTKTAEGDPEKREKHKRSKTAGDAVSGEGKKTSHKSKQPGLKKRSSASQDSVSTIGSKESNDRGDDDTSVSGDSLDCSHSSFTTSLGSTDDTHSQSQSVGEEPMEGAASQADATASSQESISTSQTDSGFTASKESSQTSSQNSETSSSISAPTKEPEKNKPVSTKLIKPAKSDSVEKMEVDDDDFLPDLFYIPRNSAKHDSQSNKSLKPKGPETKSNTSTIKRSDSSGEVIKKSSVHNKKGKDGGHDKPSAVPYPELKLKESKVSDMKKLDLPNVSTKESKPISHESGAKERKSNAHEARSSAKSVKQHATKETKSDSTQAANKLAVRTTSRDSISSRRIQVIDAMPILNPELPVIKGKQHKDDHKSSRRSSSKDDTRSSKLSSRVSLETEAPAKVKTWEERRASIDNAAESKGWGKSIDPLEVLGDKDLEALGLEFDDIAMDIDEWEKKETAKPVRSSSRFSSDLMSMADMKNAVKSQDYIRLRQALSHPDDCKKYNLENADSTGLTLLMIAAQLGNVDICELLVTGGANVNAVQRSGNTPLLHACENGHCTVVGTLLEMGAFINVQGSHGETAIIKAVRRGHNQVVKLLLSHGANFATHSNEGMTSLKLASITKNTEARDLITAHISKLTSVFENSINYILNNNAKVLCALFPIQCFCLYESDRFKVNFKHELNPTVPGVGTLLFISHARLSPEIKCRLHGSCAVKSVILNGVAQAPLTEDASFVMSFSPLHMGQNELEIRTVFAPRSRAKLVVCAYKAQLIGPIE